MQKRTLLIVGLCLTLLALSFMPRRTNDTPPFAGPVQALSRAPLPLLAQVAGVDRPELQRRLQAAGVTVDDATENLAAVVGPDPRRQMRVLRQLLPAATAP